MTAVKDTNAYEDEAGADTYFTPTLRNDRWTALTSTVKNAALVDATSYIDRLEWQGEKADTVTPQPLEWPRVGVEGIDDPAVMQDVRDSSCELALILAENPDYINGISDQTGDNTKRVKADTVEVEFFFSQANLTGGQLPAWIDELIGEWLQARAAGGSFGSKVTGNTDESVFTNDKRFINTGLY